MELTDGTTTVKLERDGVSVTMTIIRDGHVTYDQSRTFDTEEAAIGWMQATADYWAYEGLG